MLDFVFEPAFWASLALLIGMEVALSADNVVFISTVAAKLPEAQRQRILQIGLVAAAIFRLILLAGILWVLGLQRVAFTLAGWSPSWRELILLGGGLFLVYKAVSELHLLVEHSSGRSEANGMTISDTPTIAIAQIVLINAVFSVDSIVTAIGLTSYVQAMAIAVVVSIAILYLAATEISKVIERHPSIKALALAFLLIVGAVLVAEGLGFEVLQTYLYVAMGFGVLVLAIAKLVHRGASEAEPMPAVATATAVPERAEPTLDSIPSAPVEPHVEPIIIVEEPKSEMEENEAAVLETFEPEVVIEDDIVIPEPEDEAEPEDEEVLGEEREAVQKSRRKRPMLRRRPERLRTARRRK